MRHFLDFERPIAELEGKIEELRHLSTDSGLNIAEEVGRLETQANRLLRQSYARLTPWQKVLVARHPERPHCLDYIAGLITRFRAARRRPRLCRGPGDRRRHRPVSRAQRHGPRHREGRRHRGAGHAQFRHGAARGVSQGAPADAAGRAFRAAGADASSIPPAPIPGSMPRRAGRARRSRGRSRPASTSGCR